jgi:hypothetical protein
MRIRALISAVVPLAAVVAVAVIASKAADKPMKGRMVQLEKPVASRPVVIAKRDSARWTATTYEAAASEANKKVLASGKPTTITGEVVDVSCYLQLGKRGEAHIPCGTKCITHGQPIGLVDAQDNLYILFAEEHHPRRDGQVSLKHAYLPLLAKSATVSGMVTEMKGYRALFVRAQALAPGAPADTSEDDDQQEKHEDEDE